MKGICIQPKNHCFIQTKLSSFKLVLTKKCVLERFIMKPRRKSFKSTPQASSISCLPLTATYDSCCRHILQLLKACLLHTVQKTSLFLENIHPKANQPVGQNFTGHMAKELPSELFKQKTLNYGSLKSASASPPLCSLWVSFPFQLCRLMRGGN